MGLLAVGLFFVLAIAIIAGFLIFTGKSPAKIDSSNVNSESLYELPQSQAIEEISEANNNLNSFDYDLKYTHTLIDMNRNSSFSTKMDILTSYDILNKRATISSTSITSINPAIGETETKTVQRYAKIENDIITSTEDGITSTSKVDEGMWNSFANNPLNDIWLNGSNFTFEPDESINGQSYYVLRVYNPDYVFKQTWGYDESENAEDRNKLMAQIADKYVFKVWVNKDTLYAERTYLSVNGTLSKLNGLTWDSQRSNFNAFEVTSKITNIKK